MIEQLPEQQQIILKELKLNGKSIRELSLELKLSEAAVKTTAHRAYKTLSDLLEVTL